MMPDLPLQQNILLNICCFTYTVQWRIEKTHRFKWRPKAHACLLQHSVRTARISSEAGTITLPFPFRAHGAVTLVAKQHSMCNY